MFFKINKTILNINLGSLLSQPIIYKFYLYTSKAIKILQETL